MFSLCSCCYVVELTCPKPEPQSEAKESISDLPVSDSAKSCSPKSEISKKVGPFLSPLDLFPSSFCSMIEKPLECLSLNRHAFDRLLGPLSGILHRKLSSRTIEECPISAKHESRTIPFDDLEAKGTLGRGAFGHVQLVQDKKTKQTYALKSVGKSVIVQRGQQAHIINERKVMSLIDSQFVIKLHQTYNHDQTLHFLMEPAFGGELFSLLRDRIKFRESMARFYAASIVLAFEDLHAHHVLYRDLKPENILLDSTGYVKLTDFGFSKVCHGRTHTLCGTPDYLAPELVRGEPHGKGVDWYTLGILLFEMLASYPPYYSSEHLKTYKKIIRGTMKFPNHFSKNAVSLIKNLTHKQVTSRYGIIEGGTQTIKDHPWFKGFDWASLESRQMKAPFIPKVKNNCDLSNFEFYPDHHKPTPKYVDDGSGWDKEF